MPTLSTGDLDALASQTRAQLDFLARDFRQPIAIREAAREARREVVRNNLRAAIGDFEKATKEFVKITRILLEITEQARRDPVGDAVGVLTPIIRRIGETFSGIADTPIEAMPAARDTTSSEPEPVADSSHTPSPSTRPAPPPGTATRSTDYSVIADEYVATFDAATLDSTKSTTIDRMRSRLVNHREEYENVGRPMSIPWHFIGLIHALESGFNFGTHLHNGNPLSHRTHNVPAGRPLTPDPPFAWSTSAIDALQHHNLQLVGNWSLSRQLFELERYNGFGYRFRGLASPYLWSFSDRYLQGKFVRDGVFDSNAISRQVGAAVLIKSLITAGDISRPPN